MKNALKKFLKMKIDDDQIDDNENFENENFLKMILKIYDEDFDFEDFEINRF